MARRIALVVALAAVLAGCNAFGPPADTATPAETVTPLAVPTETQPAAAELSPPPGVDANGSVAPAALVEAHYRALDGRSFAWTFQYERSLAEGEGVANVTKRLRVGSDGSYRLERYLSGRHRGTLYAADGRSYVLTVLDNLTAVRSTDGAADYGPHLSASETVGRYFATGGAAVSRVDRDGATYYRVHLTSPPAPVRSGHAKQTIGNYTATAYLTPEGRLRTVVVDYDYTLRNDRVDVSLRATYEGVGETTVERPAWVPEQNGTATPVETPMVPEPTANETGPAATDAGATGS